MSCDSKPQFILIGGNGPGAGKTEAAKAITGYKVLKYAAALKIMVAEIARISYPVIDNHKDEPRPITISGRELAIIAKHFGRRVPIDGLFGVTLPNIRALLQHIGTNVIRKLDPNWHVRKLLEHIEPDKFYIIDDVRFHNELNAFPDATTFYILRPDLPADAHESENSLSAADFGTVVVNDGTVEQLHEKIKQAL